MLAKDFKLTSPRDFLRVKDLGKTIPSKNFLFTYFKRKVEIDSPSRFGFIITNRVAPRAVDRNRVKRMLNEAVRLQLTCLPKGYDCVFLMNKSILRAYAADLMKEVEGVLKSANVS